MCLKEPTPQEEVSLSGGQVMLHSWAGCHKQWQNSTMRGQNRCDPQQPFPKHCPLGSSRHTAPYAREEKSAGMGGLPTWKLA